MSVFIGTAGWSLPRETRAHFGAGGSVLESYATRFDAVEVNTSFYRPHRRSTWERWAASTSPGFRFAAKLPKAITHERRLVDGGEPLAGFLEQVGGLGRKLAVLIAQLPPSLIFDPAVARGFLTEVRAQTPVALACEPRHPSWFAPAADALLAEHRAARVAADPALVPAAAEPGGWTGLSYRRLHGSPEMYRTPYEAARLDDYASAIRAEQAAGRESWCMFDNTMTGAATGDALGLRDRLG